MEITPSRQLPSNILLKRMELLLMEISLNGNSTNFFTEVLTLFYSLAIDL